MGLVIQVSKDEKLKIGDAVIYFHPVSDGSILFWRRSVKLTIDADRNISVKRILKDETDYQKELEAYGIRSCD